MMLGGGLTPNQGLLETLECLHMFVEQYKISGLKLYPFDSTPKRSRWFDDAKLAYPLWEGCGAIRSGRLMPSGAFRFRTNWWRGMAIRN
jgi:hypothetical protein